MEWYYADGQQQVGPLNQTEFKTLINAQQIKDDTLVWCDEMADWQTYGSLKNTDIQIISEQIQQGQQGDSNPLSELDQLEQLVQPVQSASLNELDQLIQPLQDIQPVQQHDIREQQVQPLQDIQPVQQQDIREQQVQPLQDIQPVQQHDIREQQVQPLQDIQPAQQQDSREQQVQPLQDIQPAQQHGIQEQPVEHNHHEDSGLLVQPLQDIQPFKDIQPLDDIKTDLILDQKSNKQTCAKCENQFSENKMTFFKDKWMCESCKPGLVQKVKEDCHGSKDASSSTKLLYTGLWKRAGAKFFDMIILGFLSILIAISAGTVLGTITDPTMLVAALTGLGVSLITLWLAYTTMFLGKFGATPGKMIFRCKVVTSDGSTIGYGRALGRLFAETLSVIFLFSGYFIVIFDKKKRGLHDHICKTRVIRK